MAVNQWQFPLAGNFGFQFDYPRPIPQRLLGDEHQGTQLNTYLQDQFDLSRPGGEPNPYDQAELNGVTRRNRISEIARKLLQASRRGAAFVSNVMLSCLFGVFYYSLKLPFNTIYAFIVSLDWWLVIAFFFAVVLSPMTSTEGSGSENNIVRLTADPEYELVQDFRRWGMAMVNALFVRNDELTCLAAYSCSRASL